jgi:anti-anti-sigma factor
VEVDLREVGFLDSTALQVLLEAHQILHGKGRSLHVRATPRSAKLFHMLELDRVFPVQVDDSPETQTVH